MDKGNEKSNLKFWWPRQPWRPPNSLRGPIWPQILNLQPDYSGIYVHIPSNSHFDCLWDHGGLQKASEVTNDLGIELGDLNYTDIHMDIAPNSHFSGLWGRGGLQTASEVPSDLRIEYSDLNYPGINLHIASNSHFGGLWGHDGLQLASKVTSDLRIKLSYLDNLCSLFLWLLTVTIHLKLPESQAPSIDFVSSTKVKIDRPQSCLHVTSDCMCLTNCKPNPKIMTQCQWLQESCLGHKPCFPLVRTSFSSCGSLIGITPEIT